jgi:predicted metal-dependent hydrolase
MDFLVENGQRVPVLVRRRKGTRHLRIRFDQQNQIVASVPWHTRDSVVAQFLEKQRAWLQAQLSRVPDVCGLSEWLTKHPRLTASGDVFEVRIEQSLRRRADYVFIDGGSVILLRLPERDEASLRLLVRRFAVDALGCRVAYHAKRLCLSYSRMTVRDQSSRWGSCSSGRGISLNWRLVLLSPELQDYIILHELAHLTEMNHSQRFWALLDQYDPGRVCHEQAIDAVGAELMRVGRMPT